MNYINFRKVLSFVTALLTLSTSLLQTGVYANYEQKDDTGEYNLTFKNNPVGTVTPYDYIDLVYGTNQFARISAGEISGSFLSSPITPASFRGWKTIQLTTQTPAGSTVSVSLLACDGVTQIPGYQNLVYNGSPIDISGVSKTTYPCIQPRLQLNRGSASDPSPTLKKVTVNWEPFPKYLLKTKLPATKQSAEPITMVISYSNSYVTDTGVVIWAPLPTMSNGLMTGYTASYGQDVNPVGVPRQLNEGGKYTDVAITVTGGINIPANSVYWYFDTMPAGATKNLSFQLFSPVGTQNGTIYQIRGYADGSLADPVQSDLGRTKITSIPAPILIKDDPGTVDNLDGDIRLFGHHAFYSGFASNILYKFEIGNGATNILKFTDDIDSPYYGAEAIFNPTFTVNVSNVVSQLMANCSIASTGAAQARITALNGGSFNTSNNTIFFDQADLSGTILGVNKYLSSGFMNVNYAGCIGSGIRFDTVVTFDGDNIDPIQDIIPFYIEYIPPGDYNKGVRGEFTFPTKPFDGFYYEDSRYIYDDQDTNPKGYFYSYQGDIVEFTLNQLATIKRLGGVIYEDLLPPELEYLTGYMENPGATAVVTTTQTASGTLIRAVSSGCVPSRYFPTGTTGDSCFGKLDETRNKWGSLTFVVRARIKYLTGANACNEILVQNSGGAMPTQVSINDLNRDQDMVTIATGDRWFSSDVAGIKVKPVIGMYKIDSVEDISGPRDLYVGMTSGYSYTFHNIGKDTVLNNTVTISVPKLSVNGELRQLTISNIQGGNIDYSQLANGIIKVNIGPLSPNQNKTVTFDVGPIPNGVVEGDTYDVNVKFEGNDDTCGPVSTNANRRTVVHGVPEMSAVKIRDKDAIQAGGEVKYLIQGKNSGIAVANNTWIVDIVPPTTKFISAYTSGTYQGLTNYTCANCQVYFAQANPNLPVEISPDEPFVPSMINSANGFVKGTHIGGGERKAPAGMNVKYVAFWTDDTEENPTILPAKGSLKSSVKVGFKVQDVGTPNGGIIANQAAVISDQTLQAISNKVRTTIILNPGIDINIDSSKDSLAACEPFDYIVDYFNNGSADEQSLKIQTIIPKEVELLTGPVIVTHQWNTTSLGFGATPVGAVNIAPLPVTTIVTGTATTPTIVNFDSTIFRNTVIKPNEGGTLIFKARLKCDTPSGKTPVATTIGSYVSVADANGNILEGDASDDDPIDTYNADLVIVKSVDQTKPLAGERIGYILSMFNQGGHDAENTTITDTLPAGLCYVAGSTISLSQPDYTIGQPVISGGPCATAPTTLTWSVANGNSLNSLVGTGIFPGNSSTVYVNYKVDVINSVAQGVSLTNGAGIATSTAEDTLTNNGSSRSVIVPNPDPTTKTDLPGTALPGSDIKYTVSYENLSRSCSTGTVIFNSLPDYNSDGVADLQLQGVVAPGSQAIYYHGGPASSTAPTFSISNPTSNGWSTTPQSDVAHVAIIQGQLCDTNGLLTVTFNAKVQDVNGVKPMPGTVLTSYSTVTIDPSQVDANPSNNPSNDKVVTPNVDLWTTIKGSVEGAYPGTIPGGAIGYTIDFGNKGTVPSCSNTIDVILPTVLNPDTPLTDFTTLVLKDSLGAIMYPVTPGGSDITTTVNVSRNGPTVTASGFKYTFTLGANVCIPANAQGQFKVFGVVDDATADSTALVAYTHIQKNAGVIPEDLLTNNDDSTQTVVYRSDMVILKEGSSDRNKNGIYYEATDSNKFTSKDETIKYKISYDNLGNTFAQNTTIKEIIPEGTCFKVGSMTNLPPGSVLTYYNNTAAEGQPYTTTTAVGQPDCTIKSFTIYLGAVPAPAKFDKEDLNSDFNPANGYNISQTCEIPRFGTILTKDSAYAGTTFDINGDGFEDIIQGGYSTFTYYFLNDGAGGYDEGHKLNIAPSGPENATKLVGWDYDGDGDKDLVMSTYASAIWVYQNVGGALQTTATRIGDASYVTEFLLIDIDNDGDLDIVPRGHNGSNNANRISVNNGGGSFTQRPFHRNVYRNFNMSTGDFNHDGFVDLVTVGHDHIAGSAHSGYVDVYLNDGAGNYGTTPSWTYSLPQTQHPYSLIVHDFNNDGEQDLVTSSIDGGPVRYFRNNGAGGFNAPVNIAGSVNNAASRAIDINNDGNKDILGLGRYQQSYYILSNGNGTFQTPVFFGSSNGYTEWMGPVEEKLITLDINNDGYTDFISPNGEGTAMLYVNNSGSYAGGSSLGVGAYFFGNTLDANNDGNTDVVLFSRNSAGDQGSSILINNGLGGFVYSYNGCDSSISLLKNREGVIIPNYSNRYGGGFAYDVNNDGQKDLVSPNWDWRIFRNTGSGSFAPYYNYVNSSTTPEGTVNIGHAYDIQFVDINNDGIKDLLKSSISSWEPGDVRYYENRYYYGKSNGTFDYGGRLLSGGQTLKFVAGDFDNDGYADVITFGHHTHDLNPGIITGGQVRFYRNNAGLGFDSGTTLFVNPLNKLYDRDLGNSSPYVFYGASVGDINNDGNLDAVGFGRNGQATMYFLGNGSGGFTTMPGLNLGNVMQGTLKDFNGDGYLDLIAPERGARPYICYGNAGGFTSCALIAGVPPIYIKSMDHSVADLDGDGDLDIIFASFYEAQSSVCINNVSSFSCTSIQGSERLGGVTLVDINGDGSLDLWGDGRVSNNRYWINNGAGDFGSPVQLGYAVTESRTQSVSDIVDVNNDGKMDIVQFGYATQSKFFINNGCEKGISTCFDSYQKEGFYKAILSSFGNITAWNQLLISQNVPAGTKLTYTVYPSNGTTCNDSGAPLLAAQSVSDGLLNISSIDAVANKSICVVANFTPTLDYLSSPTLNSIVATWKGPDMPYFNFEAIVKGPINASGTIPNTVTVTTTTPEIRTTNNADQHTFNVDMTNLKIVKSVDKAAAQVGNTLVYELKWENEGPVAATNAKITDYLPAGVTFVSATSIGSTSWGSPTTVVDSVGTGLVFSLSSLAPFTTGTIQITATISSGSNGDTLTNLTKISSDTLETKSDDNESTATTIIGMYANVRPMLVCPSVAQIGQPLQLSLTYINDGNTAANNNVLSLSGDSRLTYVSSLPADGSNAGGIVTFNSASSWSNASSIPAASSGSRIITYTVPNDLSLITSDATFTFTPQISTTSAETDIYDNGGSTLSCTIAIVTTDKGNLNGKIYVDLNKNQQFDGDDILYRNGKVYMWGTDIYGKVHGPDPVNESGAYQAIFGSAPVPLGYVIESYDVSNSQGEYYFTNLVPGNYNTYFPTPAGYQTFTSVGGRQFVISGTVLLTGSQTGLGQINLGAPVGSSTAQQVVNIGVGPNTYAKFNDYALVATVPNVATTLNSVRGPKSTIITTATFENTTDLTATGVQLSITLDPGVTFTNLAPNATGFTSYSYNPTTRTLTFILPNLGLGASGSIAFYSIPTNPVTSATGQQFVFSDTIGVGGKDVCIATQGDEIKCSDNTDFASVTLPPVSNIYGNVYQDANADHLLNGTDTNLSGYQVVLGGVDVYGNQYWPSPSFSYKTYLPPFAGAVWYTGMTTTTSLTGAFAFTGLNPGRYTVFLVTTGGLIPFTSTAGNISGTAVISGTGSSQGAIDKQVIENIVLGTGQSSVNNNIGLIIRSSIGGTIYHDIENNDIYNPGNPLLSGMVVLLQGVDIFGNPVIATTGTDTNGAYLFSGLVPGTYSVSYINTNLTLTHDSAQPGIGATATGAVVSSQMMNNIVLANATNATNYNFGLIKTTLGNILGGIVYKDNDKSSRQNSGDSVYSGATVTLYGTPTTGAAITRTAVTDMFGQYLFTDLPQGTYSVSLTQSSITSEYETYASNAGVISGTTSGTGTTEGGSSNLWISGVVLGINQLSLNNNFGLISMDLTVDIVCTPQVMNPGQSASCTAVYSNVGNRTATGVNVALTLGSGLTFTPSDPSLTNLTLTPGQTGSITFTVTTPQTSGYLNQLLPVTATITSATPEVNVLVNTDTDRIMIQETNRASIAGRVYVDSIRNNLFSTGENYVTGSINVLLTGTDLYGNTINTTATIDSDGRYVFTNLLSGNYSVSIVTSTIPSTYDLIASNAGTVSGSTRGQGSTEGGIVQTVRSVNLIAGDNSVNNNFGIIGMDLTITISCSPDSIIPGSGAICTVNYSNLGNRIATGVDIVTTLPAGLFYTSSNPSLSNLTLNANQTGSFVFNVTAENNSGYLNQALVVTAAISSITPEINIAPNVSSDPILIVESPRGTVAGKVYYDNNANAIFNTGEIYQSGSIVVQLSGSNTYGSAVVLTSTIAADGSYIFTNLLSGTYTVTVLSNTIPVEYQSFASNPGTINGTTVGSSAGSTQLVGIFLGSGQNSINNNFGLISMDLTVDIVCTPQVMNPGQSASCTAVYSNVGNRTATGVNVALTLGSGLTFTPSDPSLTNLTLTPGQTGSITFTVTTPTVTGFIGMQLPVTATVTSATPELNILTNTDTDRITIQDWNMVSIAGRVYLDGNRSSIYNTGETYTSGNVVILLSGTDMYGSGVYRSMTVESDGRYMFANLLSGTYRVSISPTTIPAEYESFASNAGNVTGTIHGQGTTEGGIDAGLVNSINLAPTQNSVENNFGLVTITSSIQGIIYHDQGYTQSWSTGDSPLSGVSVQLISSTGAIVATTVTNTYGVYYFDHLFTGSYTVSYSVPTGYTADSRQVGAVNGTTTGTLGTLTTLNDIFVGNNQQGTMYNFGLVQVSRIAGFVYEDFVYDKVLGSGDISLSGITVYLASSTGVILNTMQTDAAGRYDFTGLVIGTYYVSIDAITGMTNHVANTGTYGAVIDTTHLGPIDLPQNSASVGNNFGAVYRARLDGVVYKDIAADGTKSAGDTGIAGQTVTLKTSTGWAIATSTTSSTGWYSFDNLMPDTYTVSYANSTNFLPYNIHTGSVGGTTSGFQSMTVVINPSDNAVNYDFGLIEPASVQGVTYYDNTNNDIYNSGDPLLSGMTVTLQGTTVRGEIVTLTTTTDNSGSYLFDKLTPGTYKVHYSNTNPNYFHDSAQVGINNSVLGTVASYQQIDGIGISVGDHAINYNFGLIDIAFGSRLGGIVYTDLDMSSRQTSGDSIYPGATVILQGTPTTGASFVRTTTTDSQGQYLFTNLPQGTYTVTLSGASIDNRYQAYASNAGTVSGNTTGQGTTEGGVSPFIIQNAYLGNNDTSINNNFGLISMDLTTQITCTPQLLNPGLSSVCTVTYANLGNRTATGVDVTFTLGSGLNFVGANPSLINLTLTQGQTGSITFTVSTPTQTGYIGMNIPVTTTITSATPELNVQTNTDTDLIAIQDWNMVSIAGRVYLDKDSSGIYGSGETYTSGAIYVLLSGVDMYGSGVFREVEVDSDGRYLFANLLSGSYRVTLNSDTIPSEYESFVSNPGTISGGSVMGTSTSTSQISGIYLAPTQQTYENNFGLVGSDVTITIVCNPDAIIAGQVANCTVVYTNLGSRMFTGTDVGITLGSGLIFVGANPSLSGFNLAPYASGTINFQVTSVMTGIDMVLDTPIDITATIIPSVSEVNVMPNVAHEALTVTDVYKAIIQGSIYHDVDESDYLTPIDKTLSGGVTVNLVGMDIYGSGVSLSTVTDLAGHYVFSSLTPGAYSLSIDAGTLLPNYILTTSNAGYVSGTLVGQGKTEGIANAAAINNIVVASGQASLGNNFGYIVPYDLVIYKTVSLGTGIHDNIATYTITYANLGGSKAKNVIVSDEWPAQYLAVVSSNPAYTTTATGYEWNVGDIAVGQTGQIIITGQVYTGIASGSIILNTGYIGAENTGEIFTGNNVTQANNITQGSDLAIVKTVLTDTKRPGDQVDWVINYVNNGPQTSYNTRIYDYIQEWLEYTTGSVNPDSITPVTSGQSVQYNVGTLIPGQTGQIFVTTRIQSGSAYWIDLPNVAIITGDIVDENTGNNLTMDKVHVVPATGTFEGHVYYDWNNNAIQFTGEYDASGITVLVRDATGDVVLTLVTDANGMYSGILIIGNYTTTIVPPTHFIVSTPNPTTFTILQDQHIVADDDGIYELPGHLTGHVWFDLDHSKSQNGEQNASGITVLIQKLDGTLISTLVTDANGMYSGAVPKGQYKAIVQVPAGMVSTNNGDKVFVINPEDHLFIYDFGIAPPLSTLPPVVTPPTGGGGGGGGGVDPTPTPTPAPASSSSGVPAMQEVVQKTPEVIKEIIQTVLPTPVKQETWDVVSNLLNSFKATQKHAAPVMLPKTGADM